MIRAHLQTTIHKLLEQHRFFSPEDFEIEQYSKAFGGVVRYRHDRAFYFRLYEKSTRMVTNILLGTARDELQKRVMSIPGDIAPEEDVEIDSSGDVTDAFSNWLDRLQQELTAGPVLRQIQEQRSQIERLLEDVASIPDEYFSKVEAEEMHIRLDRIQEEFASMVASASGDKAETERMISELRGMIGDLRQQIEFLTKRGWTGSALVRLARFVVKPENAGLLKGGVEVVKALLPGPNGK